MTGSIGVLANASGLVTVNRTRTSCGAALWTVMPGHAIAAGRERRAVALRRWSQERAERLSFMSLDSRDEIEQQSSGWPQACVGIGWPRPCWCPGISVAFAGSRSKTSEMPFSVNRAVRCAALLLLVGFSLISRLHAADSARVFKAGVFAVNINPTKMPVIVNGGFREKTTDSILDPLHARCLVLDDGAERIAIVVVDSCMVPRDLLDQAKADRESSRPAFASIGC